MQQRTGSAPKKTKKAPPLKTGAFNAAADPFHVLQGGPKTPPKLKTPTAPFKPGTKPFRERTAANNDKVITNKREKTRITNRFIAQHGGPVTSRPFGPGSTPAPAQDKFVPQLTARTEIAQANHARVLQGGLMSAAQLKREKEALRVVDHAPTFHDTHQLPASLADPGGFLKGRAPQGHTPTGPSKARGFQTPGGKHFLAGALDTVSRAAGTALENAASVPETALRSGSPANIKYSGGDIGSNVHPAVLDVKPMRLSHAIEDTTTRLANASNEAADKISQPDLGIPKGSISAKDIRYDDPAAEAAATKQGQVPIAALGGAYLTPEAKARADAKAIKNGWYPQELEGLNGLESLKRANSHPPGLLMRLARNAAADVFRTSAAPAAGVGFVREVASGHGQRAVDELASVAAKQTAGMVTNPVESAVSHPMNFIPAMGVAGRTLGAVGYAARTGGGARLIAAGMRDVAESEAQRAARVAEGGPHPGQEPIFLDRGAYSHNFYTQIGQRISDASARGRIGRRHALRGDLDREVRNAVNQKGADLATALHAYSKAHRAVGRKRAEVLLRIADAGGRVDIVLAHYMKRAAEDGPNSAAAGQVKFIEEKVLGHGIKDDKAAAFLATHDALSNLTSDVNIDLKRFGVTGKTFRQHEALIESLAGMGDEGAQRILLLRKMANSDVPPDVSVLRTGKQRENQATLDKVVKEHELWVERAAEPKPPRPPKGSGREAQQKWSADVKAWKTRTDRAKSSAKALGIRRKDAEKRFGTLGASAESQAMNTPVHEEIQAAYAQAVEQFAHEHLQHPDAFRPHYVERVKVKDSGAVRAQRGRGTLGFTDRVSKQPATTGETFRAGDYLIDSRSPVRNAMHASRLSATNTVFDTVVNRYGQWHGKGEVVPEGAVSVNQHTLTRLGLAMRNLDKNPVSHQDYYHEESSVRRQLADLISGTSKKERGTTEDAGYFIPKDVYERMLEYVTPESRAAHGSFVDRYERFLKQYQRALISTSPSTIVGNTLGSIPLAVASGTYRPSAWADAWRALHDPELGPLAMRGKGAASGLAGDPHNLAGRYMDFMRRQSVKGEDYSRLAAFFGKASPFARKRADELNMTVDAYLKKFVKGEIDPEKLSEFLDHAEKFLGDTVRPNGKFGRQAGHLILFHNWVGHMMKTMLWTLPVQHPGRAILLNILGQYGDEYRQVHGVWPQWMTAFLPLMHYTQDLGRYGPQNFTVAADLTQLTPQGTAGGVLDQATQDRGILANAGNILAPPWGQLLQLGLLDQSIRDAKPGDLNTPDFGRAALATGLGMIPNIHKVWTTTGQRADSLPGSPRPNMYLKPGGGHVQSPFLASGSFPLGARPGDPWWMQPIGIASRFAGAGLREVPNEGAITNAEVHRAKIAARKGHGDTSAKHRKKRYQRQYQRSLETGP